MENTKPIKESLVPLFRYTPQQFNTKLPELEDDSIFDCLLKEKWQQAETDGILRYTVNIAEWKILEGKYGLLAQLNTDRASNRRKPEDISSMSQSFDPERFNFTKIANREILLDIGDGEGNDVIAVNTSPIEWIHSLLLPKRFNCLPQKITKQSVLQAVEILLLSKSPYLRVIFNSLCAHASVNHLHWHLYYLRHRMPLEYIKVDNLKGPVFLLTEFPSKGLCLKLSSFPNYDYEELVAWTYMIVDYLQTNDIAHNVYITRAKEDKESKGYDDIRVYIWPREHSTGVKDTTAFLPAVCELFGHLSIKCKEEYDSLTESVVAEILTDVTMNPFNSIQRDLLTLIEKRMERKNSSNEQTHDT